jgi:hypothetical protein
LKNTLELTDIERGIIDTVVSRFVSERKSTPRRELVIHFREPGVLDMLVNRSLLREGDPSRREFLPTFLSFEFCSNKDHLSLAKQSVATVLHALTALFLQNDEDQMYSTDQIEVQARELGRSVAPETVWLGLYFAEEFSVLGGWAPSDNPAIKTSVRVSEWILKQKDIDSAWDNLVKQRTQWQLQRESYNPPTGFQGLLQQNTPDEFAQPAEETRDTIQIFISHSSKDRDIAFTLIELLRSALGLTDEQIRCTSVEGFQLPGGANTDAALKAEVRSARGFIGLITPYVMFELGARWGAELHMVPLLAGVGPEALAGPLKPINSLSTTNDAQLHQLVHEFATLLQISLQSPASYTRYIRKLIDEVQKHYLASKPTSDSQNREGVLERSGSRKIDSLTRERVIAVAKDFVWTKQLPKWTVIVEAKELPVRPLVLQAVGALPNDSTTSNGATAKLKSLGFEIRYNGQPA